MKKRLLIFACILFAVFLRHRWVYREMSYPFSQPEEEMVGIEIIHFQEAFPFNEITTIVDIPLSDQKEFLSEFKKVMCQKKMDPSQQVLNGNMIRITYRDQSIEMIAYSTAFYYPTSGDPCFPHYHFDDQEFSCFVDSVIQAAQD